MRSETWDNGEVRGTALASGKKVRKSLFQTDEPNKIATDRKTEITGLEEAVSLVDCVEGLGVQVALVTELGTEKTDEGAKVTSRFGGRT